MAIVTYQRSDSIKNIGSSLLAKEGFVNVAQGRILSQFVNALSSSLEGDYSRVYSIANNIDIGSASGDYLDRWGRILGVPRSKTSIASDLTISNASISISPLTTAQNLTTGGLPLIIPKGTQLGNGTSWPLATVDTIAIAPSSNSVFCRVMATSSDISSVTTDQITSVNLPMNQIAGVNSSIAPSYYLDASLRYDIHNSLVMSNDDEYRYILLQKANSIGLFNQSTIMSLLSVDGVANVYLRKYFGGLDVYVEPTNNTLATQVLDVCRTIIEQGRYGSSVNVLLPRYRNVRMAIHLSLSSADPTLSDVSKVPSLITEAINGQAMGQNIDFGRIISTNVLPYLSSNVLRCSIISSSYNLRKIVGTTVVQNFNEKAITLEENIQVSS